MEESQPEPTRPDPGALRLKKRKNPEEEHLREAARSAAESAKASSKRKPKKPGRTSGSIKVRMLGLTLGPCVMGLVVLGLYLAHQHQEWGIFDPEQALLIRNIAIVSFLTVVVLEAFLEDLLQGILCFFLPPYTFLYGLFFADAGPIRGLTIAVLIFFGAEMYYRPEEALVPTVQGAINNWIQKGQDKLIYPDGRPDALER